jgi:hypothetical protein
MCRSLKNSLKRGMSPRRPSRETHKWPLQQSEIERDAFHRNGLRWGKLAHQGHLGRPTMLFKQRCHYTGVINFFSDVDPLIAAGSIVQTAPAEFIWRSHVADHCFGTARFLPVAEAHLNRALGIRKASATARYEADAVVPA